MRTQGSVSDQKSEDGAEILGKKEWNAPRLSTWEIPEETLTNGGSGSPLKYEWVMDNEKCDEAEKKD